MNLKEIKELISLMNENALTEIEIEREGSKIKIKKGAEGFEFSGPRPTVEYRPGPVSEVHSAPAAAASGSGKSTNAISSPMVGTFYRAPSPETPSFVEVGQTVEIGQIVCIVEAMKLMNEIKSEVKGRIVEVAVENGEPVEFGQTLFVVEPVG